MIVSASLLGCDLSQLKEEIKKVEQNGCEWLHYDVMDGLFVPNISFGQPVLKAVKKSSQGFIDTHLMIADPEKYIKEFADFGSDLITFHIEATKKPEECIELIHSAGCKCGISIKPNTPVSEIAEFLPLVDLVLVMSVEPGFGGQSFMPSCLEKISSLCKIIDENNYKCLIEVDGGINADTSKLIKNAGADVAVSGSYLFKAEDTKQAIESLR